MFSMFRVGYSEDIHKLVPGRRLMLGGAHVPFELGEEAHSDGDVVLHALSESILGALALGDLGKHFPDTSADTLNMDSKLILKHVYELMKEKGYEFGNADVSIVLERPKLKDYIEQMRINIATLLETNIENVSLKAGTNEGCGEVGRGEAVEATSNVLLKK